MTVESAMKVNDSMPINVGWYYQMYPEQSSNWVEVIAIEDGMVTVRGREDTIAAWSVPIWKFDDLVVAYMIKGSFIETEDELFILAAEDGTDLLGS